MRHRHPLGPQDPVHPEDLDYQGYLAVLEDLVHLGDLDCLDYQGFLVLPVSPEHPRDLRTPS